jgi:hypothetical protein
MNRANCVRVHDHQTRIGQPGRDGPFFPYTENGDQVGVYGSKQQGRTPQVGLIMNLDFIELAPKEARALAFTLLHHCKQVDPQQKF